MDKLPITALVVTKNEAGRIAKCLGALGDFQKIIVVDSGSTDGTPDMARALGAEVHDFKWNGQYPKKRQWCLDHLQDAFAGDWIFFIDADEIASPDLIAEMRGIDQDAAGYFVRGVYVFEGRPLRHGMCNNKLALVNWRKMEFPVVDDLDLSGMGEIEGHYQPVLKKGAEGRIWQLEAALLHEACEDMDAWHARHQRYRAWERGMDARGAWPVEDSKLRRWVKRGFRVLPPALRGAVAFMHSYVWKLGVLDGGRGYRFATLRAGYYSDSNQE